MSQSQSANTVSEMFDGGGSFQLEDKLQKESTPPAGTLLPLRRIVGERSARLYVWSKFKPCPCRLDLLARGYHAEHARS